MWLIIVLLGIVGLRVCGTPVDTLINPQRGSENGPIITAGIQTDSVDGRVPVRREIRDLQTNYPDQWNLYLLGLRSLMMYDQSSPVSYYQIAGIHGRPFKLWQDVEGIPGRTGGYCPHGNRMFLGWHRPYLGLFEQELQTHMVAIAQQFTPELKERYVAASMNFRIPYWDWGLGPEGPDLPEAFVWPTIQVIGTDGTGQMIPNPLYSFEFNQIQGDFEGKWVNYNHTLRWPTSNLPDATSNMNEVIARFNGQKFNLVDALSGLFAQYRTMNDFSIRLEEVHGWIHWVIGGNDNWGHMWPAVYSAFDPVFMLHHSNVDRLWALWQATHPDAHLEPSQVTGEENMWLKTDDWVNATTPLLPFWKDTNSFWTTEAIMDTRTLRYVYTETQSWNYASEAEYQAAINETILKLYPDPVRKRLTTPSSENTGTSGISLSRLLVDNIYTDWKIQVKGLGARLPLTFVVEFFLIGDFSSDPITDVGMWTMSRQPVEYTDSAKMKRLESLEPDMKGTVGLTATLLDHIAAGKLESLDARDVVPYLTDKLSWKLMGDGSRGSQTDLAGLTVEVVSSSVRIPEDATRMLEYSDEWTAYPEITMGKAGGVKP